ncbi:MAG TPA: choline/ethanolamine kinase family protein [Chitinophaga sp.]|uniref:choline/ethanolamine kinase family protein n=1 Tax=Chitinophaga sp. TaxID=1869181 RepID=UPI002BA6C6EB|nr:choline/ethanolamine kinase family protein [Chitinophaga sp.]HVI45104.1 choline/ethanolamine kinase family protein [Chitinophaga sp.]
MLRKRSETDFSHELVSLMADEDKQALHTLLCNCVSVERLSEGMTNLNFKVIVPGDEFVIRIPGRGTATFIDRNVEWENYQMVAPLDISAEEIYYNKHTGLRVTRYIDNVFIALCRSDKAKLALGPLKKVHQSGAQLPVVFTGPVMLRAYEQIAAASGVRISPVYYLLKHQLPGNQQLTCPDNSLLAPCHNDPVPENFIQDKQGKIYLIDWEYGGMNDPVWDLAALVLEMELKDDEEEIVLQSYFKVTEVSDPVRIRMTTCKMYQDLLWYVWALIKTKIGSDLYAYAHNRLRRAEKNAGSIHYLV